MGPSTKHHKIVVLENSWAPIPKIVLPAGHTFELVEYPLTTYAQAAERIKDANIVINTVVRLDATNLSEDVCPNLQLISIMASGTDAVDMEACRRRGITVQSCKGANAVAVAEHAISMCLAARRVFGVAQARMRAGVWMENKTIMFATALRDGAGGMPPSWSEEVVAVLGHGEIGQQVCKKAGLLGMKVLTVERKAAKTCREGRTPFDEAIRQATLLVCCTPHKPETVDLISHAEFDAMQPSTIVVNVSRGGIVNEDALLDALREKKIRGAGLDVWTTEGAGPENTPLLREDMKDLNLIATPHAAWFATSTITSFEKFLVENLYTWCEGKPTRVVEM